MSGNTPEESTQLQMMRLLWPSVIVVQAIHAAADLQLAELLANRPMTVDELARATGADPASLVRLLRALTSVGVFAEEPAGCFGQTPLSDTLRRDAPQSMFAWARIWPDLFWDPCSELSHTVMTGEPAFESIYGQPFFAFLGDHPEAAAVFNAAMGSGPLVQPLVATYDFNQFAEIVDVGGGHGALLDAILMANPAPRCVLFDLPDVVDGAAALRRNEVAGRCTIVGGDFFQSVPPGADAYVLKSVIHDWNDDQAVKILANCRRAMDATGVLLVAETISNPAQQAAAAMMDLLLMVMTYGRKRTEAEYCRILQSAGFELARVIPTTGPSLLECRPV